MLYKDLTPKQQKYLQVAFKACSEFIPEDATHIDEDFSENHKNKVLKITQEGTQYFLGVRGNWCDAEEFRAKTDNYFEIPIDLCRLTGKVLHIGDVESENIEEPLQPSFPDFPFKLSCGDRPEVRQWLKDNGCKWIGDLDTDLITVMLDCKFLYVYGAGTVTYIVEEEAWKAVKKDWPVIEPIFKVTGYKLTEESKARKQKLDKITELRNNVKDLQKKIEELEKDLRGN